MRILLVAEEAAGIQALRLLAGSGHEIVGVLTARPTHGGGATVATVADALGLPVVPSEQVKDPSFAVQVRAEAVDLLLNVHSLFVIHADVLAAPRVGSFNLHPGPLPAYAGLNAPSWAIYRGEPRHAVTLHWMEPGIDTGAIAYAAEFDVDSRATGLSVSMRCVREGLGLVSQLLTDAAAGTIPAVAQANEGRCYFGRHPPEEGRISWRRPARELDAFVRACDYFPFASPWGHPTARAEGRELEVLKASLTGKPSDEQPGTTAGVDGSGMLVATGDDWLLVERVRLDGETLDGVTALTPGVCLEDG